MVDHIHYNSLLFPPASVRRLENLQAPLFHGARDGRAFCAYYSSHATSRSLFSLTFARYLTTGFTGCLTRRFEGCVTCLPTYFTAGSLFDAGLSVEPLDGVSLSYDFTGVSYDKYSKNGNDTHSVGLRGKIECGKATLGLGADVSKIALDGEKYLDMQMFSPSVSYLSDLGLYTGATLTLNEKDFVNASNNGFDADVENVSLLGI